MKHIIITDMTLRESAVNAELSMSFREKIEIAKLLDTLNVDVIETAPIENTKADTLLMRTICPLLKHSVLSCSTGFTKEGADAAYRAISGAKRPRLHVIAPISTVQMEYASHKKPQQMLEAIDEHIRYCTTLTPDVEFTAEDATRAERSFLVEVIKTAIAAGAKTITICDSAGTMLPDTFGKFIAELPAEIPALGEVTLGVQCSDELSVATANSFVAACFGARQIKTAVGGTDCPSLESISHIMQSHGDAHGISCQLNKTDIRRTCERMRWLANTKKAAPTAGSGLNAGIDGEIALDATSDIATVGAAVKRMGYELSEEDLTKLYEEFSRVARKKNVTSKDLDMIIATTALQVPPTYKVKSYVVNSGNVISATAHICLEKQDKILEGISIGDGPIDAAFLAIEQIIGHHYELDDFQIQAVTEGREAMGSALVKLRSNGKLFSGRGISTDIIGASIRAYVNALNKIVYEESSV